VVVNNMSKLRLVWSILKQVTSGQVRIYEDKKYHRNQIHYFQTAQLSIQNPKHAPLHIDGDPVDTAEAFDIKVIRDAFKLLMPA
jgi:diacylglycerol kinase family enzyme